MNTQPWHIAVLIPARNEEKLLPRCLESIQRARRQLGFHATCDVVVVSDCSEDDTAAIAEAILRGSGIVLQSQIGIVGSARAEAARTALQRTDVAPAKVWLANTDADCEVPKHWLSQQLKYAMDGFDAVAGTVDVDSFTEHRSFVEHLFRFTYQINPDGSHPHVHGANFGVLADAYLAAGGWGPLESGEDHDLWDRLGLVGCRLLSQSAFQVTTSGRRVGRAPAGFAAALAAHNESFA
jgi:glycosyltransferase involved in cell wall biosynthesis